MNKARTLTFAAALLALTGCGGLKKKPNPPLVTPPPPVEEPTFTELPTRTNAEKAQFKASAPSLTLFYTKGDSIIKYVPSTGIEVDFTASITGNFGPIVRNPRVFSGLENTI